MKPLCQIRNLLICGSVTIKMKKCPLEKGRKVINYPHMKIVFHSLITMEEKNTTTWNTVLFIHYSKLASTIKALFVMLLKYFSLSEVTDSCIKVFWKPECLSLLLSPALWAPFFCLCRPAVWLLRRQYCLPIVLGHAFSNKYPVPVLRMQSFSSCVREVCLCQSLYCNSCLVTHTIGHDLFLLFPLLLEDWPPEQLTLKYILFYTLLVRIYKNHWHKWVPGNVF